MPWKQFLISFVAAFQVEEEFFYPVLNPNLVQFVQIIGFLLIRSKCSDEPPGKDLFRELKVWLLSLSFSLSLSLSLLLSLTLLRTLTHSDPFFNRKLINCHNFLPEKLIRLQALKSGPI